MTPTLFKVYQLNINNNNNNLILIKEVLMLLKRKGLSSHNMYINMILQKG